MGTVRTTAIGLVFLVLASCGERKRVATLDFAAYGDCRHQPEIHRRIAKSMALGNPRFVLVTGDLVDAPEDEKAWNEFRDIETVLRKRPYYCAIGDHDGGSKHLFQKELGLERLYYDKREGDFHIFVLNSGGKFLDHEQVEWLEKTASASTAKHKFAVFHHPPFMIDRDRGGEADVLRPQIHQRLVRLKFCAAFCGHQHAFYTTLRDGVRYVVTAGGGAPLWSIDPALGQKGDLSRSFHHFVGLIVAGPNIEGHVYDRDGLEEGDLSFTLCEHPVGP
jgi:3',5'-cyclic AMP phosphodiesterase CpdA